MTEPEYKRKRVQIRPDVLYSLFAVSTPRYLQCIEGLPEKARFIGMAYDAQCDLYELIFEAEEWEPVPWGLKLPVLHIQYKQFHVLPLLEQAERLITAMYGDDASRWLEEWKKLKGDLT